MIQEPIHSDAPLQPIDSKSSEGKPYITKIRYWYRQLPDKKRYLEFITALLTIPVLLTVIITNVQSLQRQKENEANSKLSPTTTVQTTYEPTPSVTRVISTPIEAISVTPSLTPSAQCKKEVGPVAILYPEEGSQITKNPVCLDISRSGSDYCAVVWSYRINDDTWSDYTDKSICIYGLSPGAKRVDLRVKSIVTGAETVLTRNFSIPSTPSPTASSSPSGALSN